MTESKDTSPTDLVKAGARPQEPSKALEQNAEIAAMVAMEFEPDAPSLRTCGEWAEAFGHTDPELTGRKPGDAVYVPKERPVSASFRRWIYAATAAQAGWGTKLADDVPMTRAEYTAAVKAALDLPVGEHHRDLAKEAGAKASKKEKAR